MTEDHEAAGTERGTSTGDGDGEEDAKLDVTWDENFEVTVHATCPRCGTVTKIKARSKAHTLCGKPLL